MAIESEFNVSDVGNVCYGADVVKTFFRKVLMSFVFEYGAVIIQEKNHIFFFHFRMKE